jgi:hypothetical protein
MVRIELPAAASHLPPAVYSGGGIARDFQRLDFEIVAAPVASLVMVNLLLQGYADRKWAILHSTGDWNKSTVTISADGVVVGGDSRNTGRNTDRVTLSASASIRVEPNRTMTIAVVLESDTQLTVESGYGSLTRLSVTF